MAQCDYCGSTILFGGVSDNDLRFCNDKCHQQGYLLAVADQVPSDVMSKQVAEVHQGDCPKCGGPGPIDVHTSYIVWSAFVITSWQSRPQVCCRACGIKSKLGCAAVSGVAGWWGFPWGLIFTPIQLFRNIYGIISPPDSTMPSAQLENFVKIHLAAHLVNAQSQLGMDE
jgi:DNA-directed RNA polymerase subunit RPC12/RpoP